MYIFTKSPYTSQWKLDGHEFKYKKEGKQLHKDKIHSAWLKRYTFVISTYVSPVPVLGSTCGALSLLR